MSHTYPCQVPVTSGHGFTVRVSRLLKLRCSRCRNANLCWAAPFLNFLQSSYFGTLPPARLVFSLLHDSLDFLCMEVVVVSSNLILGTSIWAPGAGSGIEKKIVVYKGTFSAPRVKLRTCPLLCKPRVFRPYFPQSQQGQQTRTNEENRTHKPEQKRNRVAPLWLAACQQEKTTDQPRDYESAAFLTAYNKNPPLLLSTSFTPETKEEHRQHKTKKPKDPLREALCQKTPLRDDGVQGQHRASSSICG